MSIQRALLDKVYDIGHKLTSINRVPFEKLREREQFRLSLPEPADYLERSFFQYLCQYHEHPNLRGALNVLCVPIAIYLAARLLIFRMSATVSRKDCGLQVAAPSRIIGIMDASVDILPSAIFRTEEKIPIYPMRGDIKFDAVAGEIAEKMLKRYWNEPHFFSKCVLKILRYAALKADTDCGVIVASAEYSFASSAATEYCGSRGIRHVNVMHGEKIINPVDSFCGFHDFYVWHEHYIELFREMRSYAERFIISTPSFWQCLEEISGEETPVYDLTYYLGWELSTADVVKIRATLIPLRERGLKICVRMHPLFGNRTTMREVFDGFTIENPIDVSLQESLKKTACVVSLFTTAFWQARSAHREVVIDDVSNPDFYERLSEVRYLWVSKSHSLLSKRFAV